MLVSAYREQEDDERDLVLVQFSVAALSDRRNLPNSLAGGQRPMLPKLASGASDKLSAELRPAFSEEGEWLHVNAGQGNVTQGSLSSPAAFRPRHKGPNPRRLDEPDSGPCATRHRTRGSETRLVQIRFSVP